METATFILAAATVALALATIWLAVESKRASVRQIRVQTWLTLKDRFDSKEIKTARKALAHKLRTYDASKHDKITEEVLDLFADIGTVYNLGLLNKELAESTFSFYVNHWWAAAKSYIEQERKNKGDDDLLFGEFEKVADAMKKYDGKIPAADIDKFLNEEARLPCE